MIEDAAMPYNPAEDDPAPRGGIQGAMAVAEQELSQQRGIEGVGMSKTLGGQDAIVVYVADEKTLNRLPATIGRFPVVGEVTGEIRPQ